MAAKPCPECCAFSWKCIQRKFLITAFLAAQPECICSVSYAVTILLTQPECPHKSTARTRQWLFYALQYSEMPSCVLLLFHMLRVYLHFNRFCHLQPKVLSSLSRSLPDPFLSGTCVSVIDTRAGPPAPSRCTSKRLSRICTQGQQHYAKHKPGPLGHVERCCWWKTPLPSPLALRNSCNHITCLAGNLRHGPQKGRMSRRKIQGKI